MNDRTALVTGVTGQDGSYLSELLLYEGYDVHGVVRRGSTINTTRIDNLLPRGLNLHYGDLADSNSIVSILNKVKPDEIYNMASMSHVRVSFDIPIYTGDVTGLGPARILEALRALNMIDVKYYQASSSEMFGITPPPQNEASPMHPVSPYGCAKLYAYHMTRTYRYGYNMFASNGILFNHESPRRGETFVTKKIVRGAVEIKLGLRDKIYLGNLNARRDWGHAADYMRAVHKILQHDEPDDFVIATKEHHSVEDFLKKTFEILELDVDDHVVIKDDYFRPNEVPDLQGDASKARRILNWKPQVSFSELVEGMVYSVKSDIENEFSRRIFP